MEARQIGKPIPASAPMPHRATPDGFVPFRSTSGRILAAGKFGPPLLAAQRLSRCYLGTPVLLGIVSWGNTPEFKYFQRATNIAIFRIGSDDPALRRSCTGIDGDRMIETQDFIGFDAWIAAGVLINSVPHIIEKISLVGHLVDTVNIRPLFEQFSLVSKIDRTIGAAMP